MANLLGTPSLAPQNRKTDLSGASKSPPAAPTVESANGVDANVNSGDEIDNAEKPKQEKSRLKSSWDAVASFFGVAAPESTGSGAEPFGSNEPSDESQSQKSDASKSRQGARPPAGKKTKPSMWGDDDVGSVAAESPKVESPKVESPKNELPRSAFETKGSSNREAENANLESSLSGRTDSGRTDSGRTQRAPRTPDAEIASEGSGEFGVGSDRRSNRRPPRRGRSREASEDTGVEASSVHRDVVAEGSSADQGSDRERLDSRSDAPRSGQRNGRSGRPSDRDRSDRDRGERDRPARTESARGEPREEMSDRNDRSSRDEGRRSESNRDINQQETASRDGARRDKPRREDSRREEPRREEPRREEQVREESRGGGRRQESRPRDRDGDGDERDSRTGDRVASGERRDRSRGPRENDRSARSQSPERKSSARPEPGKDEVRSRSGFGAGIQDDVDRDDEFVRDDSRDYEDTSSGFVEVDDSDADDMDFRASPEASGEEGESDRERRPRRRRRRGSKDRERTEGNGERSKSRSGSATDSARESNRNESDEEAEEGIRHSKIPSWLETITAIVDSNIVNHERSQNSGRGGSRGRGRR